MISSIFQYIENKVKSTFLDNIDYDTNSHTLIIGIDKIIYMASIGLAKYAQIDKFDLRANNNGSITIEIKLKVTGFSKITFFPDSITFKDQKNIFQALILSTENQFFNTNIIIQELLDTICKFRLKKMHHSG
jgi:hypothetical protein